MPISVAVNPPKTPCTKGSQGIAANTIPNICKMPGPPAPFVPAPLPNIAKSELSPQGYSTTVEIDGNAVAIRGATFESIGDMASKGTGGGLISANCHGPAKFISPGSMDVKIEGKNVQLLSDMMLNNCGPSGSPPNTGATMGGLLQMAKAKNPAGEDICGAGKHTERVDYPDVPPDEWSPAKRAAAKRAAATTPEEIAECDAADYNIRQGHITHGSQISRNTTPEEEEAGAHPDDQKIWLVCTKCGYRREADEAPNKNSTVEVKSTEDALGASTQKTNNAARAAAGNSVTYKCPTIQSYQRYESLIESGFTVVQIL
jgi:hypothetical protein